MLDLVVSIINTNNEQFLKNCLESIITQTKGITYEVWVIDNASCDNSVNM
ncbi:MAG: glycosyltransferase, partial [Candidatus Omnitrophica bacterium]|nr:glycosyltransferase [Candidatus Omnitrophota bacterium]